LIIAAIIRWLLSKIALARRLMPFSMAPFNSTLDRTVVSLPNGQVASATLESFSSRDKFWFHHFVGVTYDTTAAQLRSITKNIVQTLIGHERIDVGTVRVSLLTIRAILSRSGTVRVRSSRRRRPIFLRSSKPCSSASWR
jgi:small-conductance mechanosensitive channel